MKAWMIVAIILLLLLIPFFLKVRIFVSYKDSIFIEARYLFWKIVFPSNKSEKKHKKKKVRKDKQVEEKPKLEFRDIFIKHGISGFIDLLNDAVEVYKKHKQHLKFTAVDSVVLDISVSRDNAADTAIFYGEMCAVVYPAFSLISKVCKHKKCEVSVYPDFNKKDSQVNFSAELSIRLMFVVSFAISLGIDAVKIYLNFKRGKYEKIEVKDGAENGKSPD